MARGFESKDVEFQQEEAARRRRLGPILTAAEVAAQARQRTLGLALTNARAELGAATNPTHRLMLQRKIDALQQQLRSSE
jgi:hypothetical protein